MFISKSSIPKILTCWFNIDQFHLNVNGSFRLSLVLMFFGSRAHHVNTHIQHTAIFIACNYPNLFIRAKIRKIRYTPVVLNVVSRGGRNYMYVIASLVLFSDK